MSDLQTRLIAKIVEAGVDETRLQEALAVFEPKAQKIQQTENQYFMSESETCKFCGGVSRSTLWHWRKAGLQSYQVGGRRLFLGEDIRKFIISQTHTTENLKSKEN